MSDQIAICPFCGEDGRAGVDARDESEVSRADDGTLPFDFPALAEQAASLLSRRGLKLDGSAASVFVLDLFISRRWGREPLGGPAWTPDDRLLDVIVLTGAYLGEVFRALSGGRWSIDSRQPDNPLHATLVLGEGGRVRPLWRVFERFRKGESHSLFSYLSAFVSKAEPPLSLYSTPAWIAQINHLSASGNWIFARHVCEEILEHRPDEARLWWLEAGILERVASSSEALAAYRRFMELTPPSDERARAGARARIQALGERASQTSSPDDDLVETLAGGGSRKPGGHAGNLSSTPSRDERGDGDQADGASDLLLEAHDGDASNDGEAAFTLEVDEITSGSIGNDAIEDLDPALWAMDDAFERSSGGRHGEDSEARAFFHGDSESGVPNREEKGGGRQGEEPGPGEQAESLSSASSVPEPGKGRGGEAGGSASKPASVGRRPRGGEGDLRSLIGAGAAATLRAAAEVLYCEAADLWRRERFAETMMLLERCTLIDETYIPAWLARANLLVNQGRPEAALPNYAMVLQLDPRNISALKGHATVLLEAGLHAEALEAFERILEQAPADVDALIGRGVCLGARGAVEDALRSLEKALELAPEQGQAWVACGVLHARNADYSRAYAAVERSLALNPRSLYAHFWKGRIALELGKKEEALAAMRHFLTQNRGGFEDEVREAERILKKMGDASLLPFSLQS